MSKPAFERNDVRFMDDLRTAKNQLLIVDYDGTIAPYCVDRRCALPYPDIHRLLHCIRTTCRTHLVIVSGRTVAETAALLGIHPLPEIWGTHGVERQRVDGRYEEIGISIDALTALAEAEMLLQRRGLGGLAEIKLAAVAVHWRGLARSDVLAVSSIAYEILEPFASESDLVLSEFEQGIELRLAAANKGNILRTLLSEVDRDVPVAYLGDDTTDEEAFHVLNGRGLTVLVRSNYASTAAQIWLQPPGELSQFFRDWILATGGGEKVA